MKLSAFITYCELKGLVQSRMCVNADWDPEVDGHQKLSIFSEDNRVRLNITYAVLHDQAVLVDSNMYVMTRAGLPEDLAIMLTLLCLT